MDHHNYIEFNSPTLWKWNNILLYNIKMNPFIFGFVIALQGLFTFNVTYAENVKPPKIIHKSLDTHKINISFI